jgi:hypothetical protein
MANISYEFATTLLIGFLPYNKKPLYYTVLFVYEQKQLNYLYLIPSKTQQKH